MAQSFLIFDFGSNEEAAQLARHSIERWKQGFRLDKKLLLKFEREEPKPEDQAKGAGQAEAESGSKAGAKPAGKSGAAATAESHTILIVRLDFSDHERLSHQRWLERIPADAAFKDAHPKVIRLGDPDFAATADRFDELS